MFIQILIRFVLGDPIYNSHPCSANGLEPNKRQTIAWTNEHHVYWSRCASPSINHVVDQDAVEKKQNIQFRFKAVYCDSPFTYNEF